MRAATTCLLALACALAAPRAARGQPPSATPPAATPPAATPPAAVVTGLVLEQRVTDELATEGAALANRGLRLQIEPVADHWLVSLIDARSGRVAASTRIDRLPPDRDAAVAVMVQIAADLEAQAIVAASRAATTPTTDAPAATAPLRAVQPTKDSAAAAPDAAAELSFRRASLRFAARYDFASYGKLTVDRHWVVSRATRAARSTHPSSTARSAATIWPAPIAGERSGGSRASSSAASAS